MGAILPAVQHVEAQANSEAMTSGEPLCQLCGISGPERRVLQQTKNRFDAWCLNTGTALAAPCEK